LSCTEWAEKLEDFEVRVSDVSLLTALTFLPYPLISATSSKLHAVARMDTAQLMLFRTPFNDPDFFFELKVDGFPALAVGI
jgi:hypothetical protein